MGSETEIASLISNLQRTNPELYMALTLMNDKVTAIDEQLNPSIRQSTSVSSVSYSSAVIPPANFVATPNGSTLRFTWDASSTGFQYEVRRGSDWATASLLFRTTGLQADIDPLLAGDYIFLIRSITLGNVYSALSTSVDVTVTSPLGITLTGQVIDNNVLLTWDPPSSYFSIDYYILKKGGVEIGQLFSTFATIFEQAPGTFVYSVIAVDVAGNHGAALTTTLVVNTPPDYALQDYRVSALGGTLVNVLKRTAGPTLVASWVSETYQAHFTSRGWASMQAQITAGYPIYIQPTTVTLGSYEERIDYGTTLTNVIVAIRYTELQLGATNVAIVVKMKVSTDDITYTAYTSGSVQYFTSFRYLKFKLEFTGASDKALVEVSNVNISLDVKRENDGGQVAALSTDVSGTAVTFNKAFKDIETLTATVRGTVTPYIVIIDFTDIPNPTTFYVYVYNAAGTRQSKTVDWKARGIV